MELLYDYMKDDILRHKLNTLARKTFGIDFENWVMEGYFEGDYLPYSFLEDEKIIANVSVNISRIDTEYNCLKLGFSPCNEDVCMFEASAYDGENDYRLFYRGKELERIEKEMLFFPQLSHA